MWSCDPPALRGGPAEGAMDLSQVRYLNSHSRQWTIKFTINSLEVDRRVAPPAA